MWKDEEQPDSEGLYFELKLAENISGDLSLKKQGEEDPKIYKVEVDFEKKRIIAASGDKTELKIKAIESIDKANIQFFILQPDAQFLRSKDKAYVQAKLTATENEDDEVNGKGVTRSSIVLYTVSKKKKQKQRTREKKLKKILKTRIVIEP